MYSGILIRLILCLTVTAPAVAISTENPASDELVASVAISSLPDTEKETNHWVLKLYDFATADNSVLESYVQQLRLIQSFSEQDVCNSASQKTLHQALQSNPTSLSAYYLLFSCAQTEQLTSEAERYSDALMGIVSAMVIRGKGESTDLPLYFRELDEIYIALPLAGLHIVDMEIVLHYDRFLYKAYVVDEETGGFQVRYLSNFEFMRQLRTLLHAEEVGDDKVSQQAITQFVRADQSFARLFLAKALLREKQYGKVRELLLTHKDTSPLAKVLIAQSYLLEGDDTNLEPLLPDLISSYEQGGVFAAAFLAQLSFLKEQPDRAVAEAMAILKESKDTQRISISYQVFAELLAMHRESTIHLKKWLGEKPEQGQLDAVQKLSESVQQLGARYHQGQDKPLMQLLADYKQPSALYDLAWWYLHQGDDVEKNAVIGRLYLEQSAELGNADAELDLGFAKAQGKYGYSSDKNAALLHYKKSAEMGNAKALRNMGFYYRDGIGVEPNVQTALNLFQQSASLGWGEAYCMAGVTHTADGPHQDHEQARSLFELGALATLDDAKSSLECLYGLGRLYQSVFHQPEVAATWYKGAGQAGSAEAWYNLARMHVDGELKDSDIRQAAYFYQLAVDAGHGTAAANLGFLYEEGALGAVDLHKAHQLYQLAADRQDPQGMNNLATFYREGIVVKKDLAKAEQLYLKASEAGNDYAANNLAKMYMFSANAEPEKACSFFKLAAERNFSEAFSFFADCVPEQQLDDALPIFEQAIAQGNAEAAEVLASLYWRGEKTSKSKEKTLLTLRQLAKINNEEAELTMGDFFYFGKGFPSDPKQARGYYEIAAAHNSARAMNNLAEIYRFGQGVSVDLDKAIELYLQASELNSAHAAFNLSELYAAGQGVKKDLVTANRWLQKASDAGLLPAIFQLGLNLIEGVGTEADPQAGKALIKKAADAGYAQAQLYLDTNKTSGKKG